MGVGAPPFLPKRRCEQHLFQMFDLDCTDSSLHLYDLAPPPARRVILGDGETCQARAPLLATPPRSAEARGGSLEVSNPTPNPSFTRHTASAQRLGGDCRPWGPTNGPMLILGPILRKVIDTRSVLTDGTQCFATLAPLPSRTSTEPTGRLHENGARNSPSPLMAMEAPNRIAWRARGRNQASEEHRCAASGPCRPHAGE